MTLNLTVLAPEAIFQSADFRLSRQDAGVTRTVSDSSCKIVQLTFAWDGLLTYTGVGGWGGRDRDLSDLVAKWLSSPGRDLSFDDVVEILAGEGSEFIDHITEVSGIRPLHTFVLAGLTPEPKLAVISNFERIGGERAQGPWDMLVTSQAVLGSRRSLVLVTGAVTPVVSRQNRRALERFVRDHSDDHGRIRHEIQLLNARVHRQNPAGPVSEECFVASLGVDGRGATSGGPPGFKMQRVIPGWNIGEEIQKAIDGIAGPGARLVGSTSVRSTSASTAQQSMAICVLTRSHMGPDGTYEVHELDRGNGSATALGGDFGRIVVGSASEAEHAPHQPCHWNAAGDLRFLPGLGGITGRAKGVLHDGSIMGAVEERDRLLRPVTWDGRGKISILPTRPGRVYGAAEQVGSDGVILGWVSTDDRGGQQFQRPAIWPDSETVRILDDLPADWGTARAGASGKVLVSAYRGNHHISMLWLEDDNVMPLADRGSLVPVGMNDHGEVVGWYRDGSGMQVAVHWHEAHGWSKLGLQPGWVPTAVDGDGTIAGGVVIDGFERPWLKPVGQEPQLLPHFAYHSHRIHGIGPEGTIVASVTADHGSHAVCWTPRV